MAFLTKLLVFLYRLPRAFKYVPLNSLTLSEHRRFSSPEGQSEEAFEESEGQNKKAWWESLPQNKMDKNKVILEEYDKLKSSMPEWPWIEALKASSPLSRKKVQRDKVRVVRPASTTEETTTTVSSTLDDSTTSEMYDMDEDEGNILFIPGQRSSNPGLPKVLAWRGSYNFHQ